MRVIDQIHERSAFTPTEREIASFLEENSQEAINLSLEELSNRIFVSKSTVIRFCKKLGFKGHKELCIELSKELSVYLIDDRRIDSSFPYEAGDDQKTLADKVYALSYGALAQTYQDLDRQQLYRVAKAMHDHTNIVIYTSDENVDYLQPFAESLNELGANARLYALSSSSVQRAAQQPSDSVSLFIIYRTKDTAAVQTARLLAIRKIPLFVITGPFKGMFSTYGQEVISASIYESEPKAVSISSRKAVGLILDILHAYYYSFDLEKNDRAIKDRFDLAKGVIDSNH
jgi:DNA-binding MurR/RpiR family transcriptional regulator